MSVFDRLQKSQSAPMPSKQEMQNLVSQLQSNPTQFLQMMGYNIPSGVNSRDPNSVIQHLMQTNQINSGILGKAYQALNLFK